MALEWLVLLQLTLSCRNLESFPIMQTRSLIRSFIILASVYGAAPRLSSAATLVVPASYSPMHIDVATPDKFGFKAGDAVELVEVGAETALAAQLLPGVAADGAPRPRTSTSRG